MERRLTRAEEAGLYRRARDGDGEAFVCLVNAHKDALLAYLGRLTGGQHDRAEDLAQEAYLRLLEGRGRWRPELGSFRSYLFRTATNLLISRERRRARWRRLAPRLESGNGHHPPEQERQIHLRELSTRLDHALGEIPALFRSPLILHHLEGWTYQQIADAMACSVGTVKSRIHRARRRLAGALTEDGS